MVVSGNRRLAGNTISRTLLLCVAIVACGEGASVATDIARVDDFGQPLPTDTTDATRVVSLNPTATELIFALGEQHRLVGRSSWDEFPAEAASVPALGDGIRPNVEAILGAQPTLVVLYATAENRAAAEALARAGVRVMALRVDRIAEFEELTLALGRALGAETTARVVVDSVRNTLTRVRETVANAARVRVAWPLWQSPLMVVGGGSYLDELVTIAGAENVFGDMTAPSPQVSLEEIARRDPDIVLAGDVGSSTIAQTDAWRVVGAVRNGNIRTVDTRLTGRPSVNLGMAAVSLARAMHPELASRLP